MKVDYYLPELADQTPESFAPKSLFEETMREREDLTRMLRQGFHLHCIIFSDHKNTKEEIGFLFDPIFGVGNVQESIEKNPKAAHSYFSDYEKSSLISTGNINLPRKPDKLSSVFYLHSHREEPGLISPEDITFNPDARADDICAFQAKIRHAILQFLRGVK